LTSPPPSPPRAAERLLELLVDAGLARDGLLGDLREEFGEHLRRTSPARAVLWYWVAAGTIVPSLALERLRRSLQHWSRTLGADATAGSSLSRGDSRMIRWLQNLGAAARTLRRAPGITAIAVFALAIGIGANVTIFGMTDAFLLRPLPFADATRLVHVWATNRDKGESQLRVSLPAFLDWKRDNAAFTDMALFNYSGAELGDAGEPEHIPIGRVSANAFQLLGVAPFLGRGFETGDDQPGRTPVAVLSYAAWQRRHGGRSDIVGEKIRIDGTVRTIVGVMPATFAFPLNTSVLWVPYELDPAVYGRDREEFQVFARLAPGVSLAAANVAMAERAGLVARDNPKEEAGRGAHVVALRDALNFAADTMRPLSFALFVAASLVLLLACANIASALLARATARTHEMSIRAALGGTRRRLIAQLMTESVLLGVLGGSAGVLLAGGALRVIDATIPAQLYRVGPLAIGPAAIVFSFALSLGTALAFGVMPALRATSGAVTSGLTQTSRSVSAAMAVRRSQDALVIVQLALTITLLIGAALVSQSLGALRRVDPGYSARGVLTLSFSPPRQRYRDDASVRRVQEALLAEARARPGVTVAAIADDLPLNHERGIQQFLANPAAGATPDAVKSANVVSVSPAYFDLLRIRQLAGRGFTEADGPDVSRVLVIDDAMRRRYWPEGDVVGRIVRLVENGLTVEATIVGVVNNTRQVSLAGSPEPTFYAPQSQSTTRYFRLLVRGDADTLALATQARQIAKAVDPALPIAEMRTLQAVVDQFLLPQRGLSAVLFVLGAGAMLLATFGVYGVMSYLVAQRTREIGVRMALGASRADVFAMVLRRGGVLALYGVVGGIAGGLAISRLLGVFLGQTNPNDPVSFGLVSFALVMVTLIACAVPARRAVSIEPATALRHE